MFSILLSLMASAIVVGVLIASTVSIGSMVFFGILSFILSFYLIAFFTRKKIKAVQNELQEIMLVGQQRMNRKVQQFQSKPGGNLKLIQRQIDADQNQLYKQGLEFTSRLEPFKKWSLLMGRQIATMQLQFSYQLKDYKRVDEILNTRGLFKGPLLMEPILVAMKMAREFKNEEIKRAEKTFKRHLKWFRGDRATLLYGLMSWIYVKEGEIEKARDLLSKAKDAIDNDTFALNWERLSNNKVKNFSNAGLGEEWFALYLEKPPAPKQQRVRMKQGKGRRF